jgi:hypothetical protein
LQQDWRSAAFLRRGGKWSAVQGARLLEAAGSNPFDASAAAA